MDDLSTTLNTQGVQVDMWSLYWQFILFFVFLSAATYLIKFPFRYFWRRGFDPNRRYARLLKLLRMLLLVASLFAGLSAIFRYSVILGQLCSVILFLVGLISQQNNLKHVLAGFILTAQKPFQRGQRIQIAEHDGTIVAKRLLHITIRTEKNELVNIPNAILLEKPYRLADGIEGFPVTCRFPTNLDPNLEMILRQVVTICPMRSASSPIELTRTYEQNNESVQLRFFTWSSQLVEFARQNINNGVQQQLNELNKRSPQQ